MDNTSGTDISERADVMIDRNPDQKSEAIGEQPIHSSGGLNGEVMITERQVDEPKVSDGQKPTEGLMAEEPKPSNDQNVEPKMTNGQSEDLKTIEGQTETPKLTEEQREALEILEEMARNDKTCVTQTQEQKSSDESIGSLQIDLGSLQESPLFGDQPSTSGYLPKPGTAGPSVEGHDWNCFECHSSKGVDPLIECTTCHRAYHSRCTRGKPMATPFRCTVCLLCQEPEKSTKVLARSRQEVNKCIELMINNLQLGYGVDEFDVFAIDEQDEDVKKQIHTMMDMLKMRHKALTGQYQFLREVVADFKQFVHNYLVLHRQAFAQIKDLERRFNHEVKEIRVCVDCYKYSSDISYDQDSNPYHWFLLVCNPPHELVFAKYQKYPFWSAKVFEVKPDGKTYDVRFFDAPDFSRALVPKKNIRSIEGFAFDDPDGDLELPVQLMEQHIKKMRQKGVYFMPTVYPPEKKHPTAQISSKKRPKAANDDNKPKKKTSKGVKGVDH